MDYLEKNKTFDAYGIVIVKTDVIDKNSFGITFLTGKLVGLRIIPRRLKNDLMGEKKSPFRDNEGESAKKGEPKSCEMYFVLSSTDAIRVNVNYVKHNQYRIQPIGIVIVVNR